MIQSSIPNPCSDIFQDNPIVVKSKHPVARFISSINKNKLGIYYHYYQKGLFDRSKGQLRLFEYKGEKWVEYYNMENSHNGRIRLLCFADNDNQLLFHKEGEHCIKSLIVNQNKLFGFITYQSSTIQIFINLTCNPDYMTATKDQKFILICDFQKYILLDVNQKTITFTISRDKQFYDSFINFFDNNYFILNLKTGKKIFYSIKTKKVEKIHFSYKTEIQKLINNSLGGFFCSKDFNNYTIVLVNMINLKFIRKIKQGIKDLQIFGLSSLKLIGILQQYLLLRFLSNNRIQLSVLDLFNLNVKISDLNSDPSVLEMNCAYELFSTNIFDNQMLAVDNRKLQQTQFWLTK